MAPRTTRAREDTRLLESRRHEKPDPPLFEGRAIGSGYFATAFLRIASFLVAIPMAAGGVPACRSGQ